MSFPPSQIAAKVVEYTHWGASSREKFPERLWFHAGIHRGPNDAGQRLDRWLAKTLPLLPAPLAQKYIRIKRVKLNGKGAKRDTRLAKGDLLQLYINDEFFDTPTPENAFLSVFKPQLDILYEDENLLLVNKRPGLVVHPDEGERVNTLITHIQAYLYQKKEWRPRPGARLRPRPVQPHRPEHRRHRHRRQERRDPADHEPKDPGPGGGEVLPLPDPGRHFPRRGEAGGVSSKR